MRVANRGNYRLIGDETEMYVGRPTVLGNPYFIGIHGGRAEVVNMYRAWITYEIEMGNEEVELALDEAADADVLLCWCAPEACHADVIQEILGL